MRQLLPAGDDAVPGDVHGVVKRPPPRDRPWVAVSMIASIDGAIALDGRSGGLGGPADRAVFAALRATADVILVAAGTARAEGYRAPRTAPDRRARRVGGGQAPFPRLAVVTRSLDLAPDAALFTDLPLGPEQPEAPLIYTVRSARRDRRTALGEVAEVVDAGDAWVALDVVLRDLHRRGTRVVLAEGGPSLIGQLLAAGLVDEVDVTIAPLLVGGPGGRLAHGPDESPTPMVLSHLWEDGGFLLARYLRR